MKSILLLIFASTLVGCASTSNERPGDQPERAPEPGPTRTVPAPEIRIDYIGLQHTLGLDRAYDDLGYHQKLFSTCAAGNGYSHTDNCHRKYFVLIHFQLMCRDTEDTVSTELSNVDITPISNRTVDWTMGGQHGETRTDSRGFGQLRTALDKSSKEQRLKLNIGREFLYMEAGEITRVVAPPSWCGKL